jgi:glycosyltransferase involved in cell wall biosynthesis
MKRILVITTNLEQASFRLRIAAMIEPLRRQGYELVVQVRPRQWLARRRLLRSAAQYDAVILQRKLLDPGDARLLRRSARRILYDVDDAVMRHIGPAGVISRWRTRRRFHATADILDHVVAGNEHLAQVFRERGRAATVIPTVVDPASYGVKAHQSTTTPRLVWIGSSSTLPYVRQHLPALEEAAGAVPGLRLLVIADQPLRAEGIQMEFEPWAADTEAASLLRGDIGIAPTPLDEWTIGKSGFKIVQYMAAGLPVIASPVGANAELVMHGETGLLCEHMSDWPAAILQLAGDAELRTRLGQAGRQRVEQSYSIARATSAWQRVLDGST